MKKLKLNKIDTLLIRLTIKRHIKIFPRIKFYLIFFNENTNDKFYMYYVFSFNLKPQIFNKTLFVSNENFHRKSDKRAISNHSEKSYNTCNNEHIVVVCNK